ncbi:hypothetical protein T01_10826 [Trichinella spiralis]|uniref:Uncharacterized protein n=1 Tax=Trichinella spiralis TaxID=6334 RepID=A0A0V0Z216_TRISP|nr:hypothetical protein T01_10826 [Trichinella spiralis]
MAPVLILLIIDIDDVISKCKEKCEPETSHISFNATLPESPKGFHL